MLVKEPRGYGVVLTSSGDEAARCPYLTPICAEPAKRGFVIDDVVAWMNDHGLREQALFGTIGILVFTATGGQIINRASQLLCKMQQHLHVAPRMVLFFTRTLNSLLWICATLLILEIWGFGVAGLWSLLINIVAVIGVGFLAVWTIVSNITASVFITIWRPFRLDETVEVLPDNVKGRVIDRNLIFTVLEESEGVIVHIPNNLFFQKIFRVVRNHDQYRFGFLEHTEKSITSGSRSTNLETVLTSSNAATTTHPATS
jgi:small-conductance mechanosensitive channel